MVLSIFKNKAAKIAMISAKNDYIKAAESNDDSRATRSFKVRIGIRCRSHIDKVFIEAAKKTVAFQDQCNVAAAQGKERPAPPKANPFQTAKTINGVIYTYIPEEFSDEVFSLGCMYQTMQIDINKAITMVQQVADRVAFDIGLDQPITALQFLRSENESESAQEPDEDIEQDSNDNNE